MTDFFDIGNLRWYFLWFMMGWVYNRKDYLNRIVINEEKPMGAIASWSLLTFMSLLIIRFKLEIPSIPLFVFKIITALSAINVLLFLSLKISKTVLSKCVICIGKASLFIYLYHELFLPRFAELGEFFKTTASYVSIPLQICSALFFCFVSISITYIIERVLNNFKLLRLLFLGKRN